MGVDIAFEAFFNVYYTKAYCLAFSIVRDEDVSKDIVAEAFEYLLSNPKQMSESELRNYLYVMVRNKCADYFRHELSRDKYAAWAKYTLPLFDDDYEEHEAKVQAVQKALEDLTPRTREILEAHYLRGQKYSEIAETLNISQSTVKKHIVAGLKLLRKKFSDEFWSVIGVCFFAFNPLY